MRKTVFKVQVFRADLKFDKMIDSDSADRVISLGVGTDDVTMFLCGHVMRASLNE